MTDKLLCPFCQQELDTKGYYVHCHNPHCNKTVEMEGNEELWQALIDTKKILVMLFLVILLKMSTNRSRLKQKITLFGIKTANQ